MAFRAFRWGKLWGSPAAPKGRRRAVRARRRQPIRTSFLEPLESRLLLAAQNAASVVEFSSQWSPGDYSAAQTTGAADVFTYGDNGRAWTAAVQDGSIERLTVGYDTPLLANGVTVRESWGNGFVTDIELRNQATGLFTSVSPGPDGSLPGSVVDYFVPFPQTPYLVDQVRITVDTDHSNVWESIDAVQLHGERPPGISINALTDQTTTEGGGRALYEVVLDSAPTANVQINLASSDTTEASVRPAVLLFTPGNALTPQTITVEGIDDAEVDGTVSYSIVTLPAISSDAAYDGRDAADLHLFNLDDEGSPPLWQPASSVVGFSSQWGSASFSAAQTLGPSDVFAYGDSINAWSPAVRDGSTEHLTLAFDTPVFADGVRIRESWGNGFVRNVELRSRLDGTFSSVFSGVDPSVGGSVVDFDVWFAQTAFPVDAVRVTIDTDHSMVWEEIDSVMLHGRPVSLTLSVDTAAVSEGAGPAAATGTVTRSGAGIGSSLVVNLASDDVSEATVPASITIPAGAHSVSFPIDAIDDALLDGAQPVTLTATAPGFSDDSQVLSVTDNERLTISVAAGSIREDAGPAATTATVSRSDTADLGTPREVTLTSSDTSEAVVPATVTIPAGSSTLTFHVTPVDDTLLDGTQTVTLTASAAGYASDTAALDVTDAESLALSIAASSIAEDSGPAATTATVTRSNTDLTSPLTVHLVNSDSSEASVPAVVTIPAGSASWTFDVDAVDDTLLDGTQTAELTASATGYAGATATVDVTDAELLSLSISSSSISEDAGPSATTATVTRSNTDHGLPLTVTLASSDNSEAAVPATITIASGSSAATFSVDAVDDNLLDGTQPVTITAAASGYSSAGAALDVTDAETLSLSIAPNSVREDAGPAATTATVTRSNTDHASPLTVTLTSSDLSEASVPATVTIPAGAASWTFDVDAVDDTVLDGTQHVTLSAAASGYNTASAALFVTDDAGLSLAVSAASIAEDAGPSATTATVTRSNTNQSAPLTVHLSSSDSTEATVPASVTIPAGSSSWTFDVAAVDDTLLDGTQNVTLTASASGYFDGTAALDVTDVEELLISVAAASIAEDAGAGATTATVTRGNTDLGAPLTVSLTNNDTSEATIPAVVTIPAGSAAWTFEIAAVDDTLLDGTQTVAIGASASGYTNASVMLDVTDVEWLTLSILAASVAEDAGAAATTATVTRSNSDIAAPLVVNLTSSDLSEATVVPTVTIPAGASSWTFEIDAVDDALLDGTQAVTVQAAAGGYVGGSDSLDVTDVESLTLSLAVPAIAEDAGPAATTGTLTRSDVDTPLPMLVSVVSSDPTEAVVPAVLTIPPGSASWTFPIGAFDDALLDGTQRVTISAVVLTHPHLRASAALDVTDAEDLTLSIAAAAIAEDAGPAATTGTVTRHNSDRHAPLTVLLSSSDTSEASVPSTVTIPAGSQSWTFPIAAVDDVLLDGTQTVTLSASAAGYRGDSGSLDVTDREPLGISLAAASIPENGGAAATVGTVTRHSSDTSAPLTVTLTSSDTSEAVVPGTVTIPAGSTSSTFNVDARDDTLLDGSQHVTITAAASGYVASNAPLEVTDVETLTVLIHTSPISEDAGDPATSATVMRSNTDTSLPLTVTLTNSDTTEATAPATVTIPAGQSTGTFNLAAVDDSLVDGTQTVTITPAAAGYLGVAAQLDVTDSESITISVNRASFTEAAGAGAAMGTVSRGHSNTSSPLTVTLSSSDTTEAVVPATVTIARGAVSATFSIDAVDDTLLDGTQTVTLTASAPALGSSSASVNVTDDEVNPDTDDLTPADSGPADPSTSGRLESKQPDETANSDPADQGLVDLAFAAVDAAHGTGDRRPAEQPQRTDREQLLDQLLADLDDLLGDTSSLGV